MTDAAYQAQVKASAEKALRESQRAAWQLRWIAAKAVVAFLVNCAIGLAILYAVVHIIL